MALNVYSASLNTHDCKNLQENGFAARVQREIDQDDQVDVEGEFSSVWWGFDIYTNSAECHAYERGAGLGQHVRVLV